MIAAVAETFQARLETLRGLVRGDLLECLTGLSPCVLGIDADSQGVSWCLLDGDRVEADTIGRTSRAGEVDPEYDARLASLLKEARARNAGVVLEGIWLASGTSTAIRNVQVFRVLAEIQGEIKAAARANGVPVVVVQPTTWHAAVLGFVRGRAELKGASMEVGRMFAGEDLDEHQSDALALALYGIARAFWREGADREAR